MNKSSILPNFIVILEKNVSEYLQKNKIVFQDFFVVLFV